MDGEDEVASVAAADFAGLSGSNMDIILEVSGFGLL